MGRLRKRRAIIGSLALFLVAGTAFAAWTIRSQGGSGRGTVGTIAAPVVTDTTPLAGTADCFPGSTCAVAISVNNPNSVPMVLTGVDYLGSTVAVQKPLGTNNAGCAVSNITWSADKLGLSIPVPAGASTVLIPATYQLAANAPIACAGSVVMLTGSNPVEYAFATA